MGQPTVMNTITASDSAQAKAKKNSRNNGYRAKELAEIRNSLRPFEQPEQQQHQQPRTISSLSTESGSCPSVCNESMLDTLAKLTQMGYDEVRAIFLHHNPVHSLSFTQRWHHFSSEFQFRFIFI